jgi:hypothetical protein
MKNKVQEMLKDHKEFIDKLTEALSNLDTKLIFYININESRVMSIATDLFKVIENNENILLIEPLTEDMYELMEDFALEQDDDEVQNYLMGKLKNKNKTLGAKNFLNSLNSYSRSQKAWDKLFCIWLQERAIEYIDDFQVRLENS